MYRNKKESHQGTTEAVKSWKCLLITVDTSFLNLKASSANPLGSQGHIQDIYFKKVI